MGVDPSIILRYFSSVETSTHFLGSVTLELFADDGSYIASEGPTLPILRASSNKPPVYTSLEYNYAFARRLLGPELSDHLAIPTPGFWMGTIKLPVLMFIQRYPVWFGRVYGRFRKGWVIKRRFVIKEVLAGSVKMALGMRRTHFRPRDEDTVDLDEAAQEAEKVKPNPKGNRAVMKAWNSMWIEMILVSVLGMVGLGLGLAVAVSSVRL